MNFYNTLGQKVAEISSRIESAGIHTLRWQPHGLASGIYFYRLQGATVRARGKMLLVK